MRGRTDAAMLLFALTISANLRTNGQTRGDGAERRVGLYRVLWQTGFVREPHTVHNVDRWSNLDRSCWNASGETGAFSQAHARHIKPRHRSHAASRMARVGHPEPTAYLKLLITQKLTDAQIHAAPTAHGLRPAVRHPHSCIAPTLPAPSHAAYSSPYPFHTSRRASSGIDRYSKQNGSIRPGRHLQSNMLRAVSSRPNPGRRSAAAFHPPRTARTPSTHHAEHHLELTDI